MKMSARQGRRLHRGHDHHRDRAELDHRPRRRRHRRHRRADERRGDRLSGLGGSAAAKSRSTRTARSASSTRGARRWKRPASRWKRRRNPAMRMRRAKRSARSIGAAIGGGDQVEALAPDMLKPFVPETLARPEAHRLLGRAQRRDGHAGVRSARDLFGRRQPLAAARSHRHGIGARASSSLAGWAAVQNDKRNRPRLREDIQAGRPARARAMGQRRRSTANTASSLGDRFAVKVSGNADSIDQLKAAVASDQYRRARSDEGRRRQEGLTRAHRPRTFARASEARRCDCSSEISRLRP